MPTQVMYLIIKRKNESEKKDAIENCSRSVTDQVDLAQNNKSWLIINTLSNISLLAKWTDQPSKCFILGHDILT